MLSCTRDRKLLPYEANNTKRKDEDCVVGRPHQTNSADGLSCDGIVIIPMASISACLARSRNLRLFRVSYARAIALSSRNADEGKLLVRSRKARARQFRSFATIQLPRAPRRRPILLWSGSVSSREIQTVRHLVFTTQGITDYNYRLVRRIAVNRLVETSVFVDERLLTNNPAVVSI